MGNKDGVARKKKEGSRFAGLVRPNLFLTEAENWAIEARRVELKMEKGEFLKACINYCLKRKVDPRT